MDSLPLALALSPVSARTSRFTRFISSPTLRSPSHAEVLLSLLSINYRIVSCVVVCLIVMLFICALALPPRAGRLDDDDHTPLHFRPFTICSRLSPSYLSSSSTPSNNAPSSSPWATPALPSLLVLPLMTCLMGLSVAYPCCPLVDGPV